MKVYLLIALILNSCLLQAQNTKFIHPDYCIMNDKENSMGMTFEKRGDTVFLTYTNIVDNGNFINAADPEDKNDYAGYFTLKQMKNMEVAFRIKSYYHIEESYMVDLKFADNGKKCIWKIKNKMTPMAYLPKNAIFKDCP